MDVKITNPEEEPGFLRRDAEHRLRTGAAPASGGPLDAEALALLYDMASDPRRSSDALRLLQELQVYQVELDLQRAQLESNEREMSHELARYRALYELTPTAALVVTGGGHIVDANPSAAALLGAREDNLAGRNLIDFLKPESQRPWQALLRHLKAGGQTVAATEVLAGRSVDGAPGTWLSVSVSPGEDELLLLVAKH